MEEQVIPVSLLAKYIKNIFDSEELLFNISVSGEISGIKTVGGVVYFDLKDEFALMPCVSFYAQDFKGFQNGDKVIANGTPNFYVKGGRLSFNVRTIKKSGLGELFLQYLALKEKLEKEGLFDESHKKPIPKDVKKIGVVSSETGAVIQDIINVATRRNPSINIVLYPSKVQGEGAEEQIISGLEYFENTDVDVVIVARGGGSMEDLNVFNSEKLARKVFDMQKVVISAIGHETDYVILDFVADLRAPTPSASAELAVENVLDKKTIFKKQCEKVLSKIDNILNSQKYILEKNCNSLLYTLKDFENNYKYFISLKKEKLSKLNPNEILKLGYAKVEKNEKLVKSKTDVENNDKIKIIFSDGSIYAKVGDK